MVMILMIDLLIYNGQINKKQRMNIRKDIIKNVKVKLSKMFVTVTVLVIHLEITDDDY